MTLLTRDQLLTPVERKIVRVDLSELGEDCHVFVQGMTAKGRSHFERQFAGKSERASERRMAEIRERLMIACVCDGEGNRLLNKDDVEALGQQAASVVELIVDACQKVCGMSSDDVETLAENSEGIQAQ